MAVRRALREQKVREATGWGRSTLYKKIREGKFPKPTKLDPSGAASVWWEDEVEAVQQGKWKPAEVSIDAV